MESTSSINAVSLYMDLFNLQDWYWVSKDALPNISKSISFEMTWEQFQLVQGACSGASFSSDPAKSIQFLADREKRLGGEASEQEEYGLQDYCSSGFRMVEGWIHLWYETTRGTVLCQIVGPAGEVGYKVHLPERRGKGYHRSIIDAALAGQTLDMYQRWYNAYMFDEERYAEQVAWHLKNMVPLGYPPLSSWEEIHHKANNSQPVADSEDEDYDGPEEDYDYE